MKINDLEKLSSELHSGEFKYRLVSRYRMGLYSPLEIWQSYGVSRSLLHKWNCQYYRNFILSVKPPNSMNSRKNSNKQRIAQLERQLRELKAAYAEEKLKRQMYEKVIRIAEEEFEMPVRKKAGAKQLRKDAGTTP
ncbi:MAG: hypothetical protein R8P61_35830 [Bacteroidia bacterium]|nr:hypothetical protein [Bacteroidia bacterium]MDW3652503.1 hypothetical protein [Bacteroidia bacterium]